MKVFIPFYQPTVNQSLLQQAVVHLLSGNPQFTCSTLYCHNGEVNMSVYAIILYSVYDSFFMLNLHVGTLYLQKYKKYSEM